MSELIQKNGDRATIRWKLLTGASALALTGYISSATLAKAEDGRPVLWLDLGGQFQSLTDPSEIWAPPNLPSVIDHRIAGVLNQKPRIGYDVDGSITYQPPGSDWSFSAAIQYGKAKKGPKADHDQTYKTHYAYNSKYVWTNYAFTDLHAVQETKHVILDFQAGRDVGLGLLGGHGSSMLKIGIRVAQFREKANSLMTAQTNVPAKYDIYTGAFLNASMHDTRSFSGIGPSIAWNGSIPMAGSLEDGLALDLGVDAAFLFGRQKTKAGTHAHKSELVSIIPTGYISGLGPVYKPIFATPTNSTRTSARDRRVTVPNLGGLVGLSFRKGDAKISFGYKADFFFNAIDGGVATAKKENRGFYGPFASVSIGIGD